MNTEMGSKKWFFKGLAFQFSIGYVLAMLITQIGSLIVYGTPAVGFVPAIIISVVVGVYLVITIKKANVKRQNLGVEV